jgi:hypothetical protein
MVVLFAAGAIATSACSEERRGETIVPSSGGTNASGDGRGSCPPPSGECSCLLPYGGGAPGAGGGGASVCIYVPCGETACFASRPGVLYECRAGGQVTEVAGSCPADDAGADTSGDASGGADAGDAASDAPI